MSELIQRITVDVQWRIAGYTLIYNSYGMILVAHMPFKSAEKAIREETDIHSQTMTVNRSAYRVMVGDTDDGRKLRKTVEDLKKLLAAYRSGELSERV